MSSTDVGKYVRALQKTPSRLVRIKSMVTPVPTEISSPKTFNSTGRKTLAPSSSTKVQTKSAAKSVKSCVAKSLSFAIQTNDNVSSSSETSAIRVKKTKNYVTSLTVNSDDYQISNRIDTPSKHETKKKSRNSIQSSSKNSRRQTTLNVTFSPNKHDEEGTGNVSLGVGLLIPATATTVAENHVDTPMNLEKSLIKLNSHRRTTLNATFSPNKHENEEYAISINQGDDLLGTTVAPVSECQVDVTQNLLESDRSEQHHQKPLNVTLSPSEHDEEVTGNESLGVGLLIPASATVAESHVDTPLNLEKSLIKLSSTILNATLSPNKHENKENAVSINQGDDLLSTTVAPVSECHVDVTQNLLESDRIEQLHQTPLNVTLSPNKHDEEMTGYESLGVGLLTSTSATVAESHVDSPLNLEKSLIKLSSTILNATFSPNKHENEENAVSINQGDDLLSMTVAPVSECHVDVTQNLLESDRIEQLHQTPLNVTFSPIRHGNEEDIVNDSLGVGLLSSALVTKRTIDKRLFNSSTPRIGSAKKVVKRLGTPRGDISTQRSFRTHGTRKVSHVHTPNVSKTKFLSAALKEKIVNNAKTQQKLVTFNSPTLKGKTPLEPRPKLFKFGATTNNGTDAGPSTWQGSVSASKTKLPNFSAIHQKLFEKMESIDETVQRRMERSKALSTKKENQAPTQPSEREKKPVVRKLATSAPPEPPKRILQSRPNKIKSRLERHQNMYKRRSNGGISGKQSQMLRGVRLNRRFDLQMKFREEQTDQQE